MSRRTQPYRRGARQPGGALVNMVRGRTVGGMNPADITRASARMARKKKRRRKRRRVPRV